VTKTPPNATTTDRVRDNGRPCRRQLTLLAGTVAALQVQHTLPSPLLASLARGSPSPLAHCSQLQPPPLPVSYSTALHRNIFVSVLVLYTSGRQQASRPSVAASSEAASAEEGGKAPLMVVTHHAALLHARVIIPSSWVRRTAPLQH
jgi:hypothetical protein